MTTGAWQPGMEAYGRDGSVLTPAQAAFSGGALVSGWRPSAGAAPEPAVNPMTGLPMVPDSTAPSLAGEGAPAASGRASGLSPGRSSGLAMAAMAVPGPVGSMLGLGNALNGISAQQQQFDMAGWGKPSFGDALAAATGIGGLGSSRVDGIGGYGAPGRGGPVGAYDFADPGVQGAARGMGAAQAQGFIDAKNVGLPDDVAASIGYAEAARADPGFGGSSADSGAGGSFDSAGNEHDGDGEHGGGGTGDAGNEGGEASGYRGGGRIHGPGTGTSDSIPIRVSNGEGILRAGTVKKLGPRLFAALNSGAWDRNALMQALSAR